VNKELKEILIGFKRALGLLGKKEKTELIFASVLMLFTGILTNLPALILGRLVDKLIDVKNIDFNLAVPFILLVILVILIKEALTIVRKYLVENIATQTEKEQTVNVIDRLLKTDIGNFLQQQQIGSLHGKIFRSIQGLVRIIKLSFLDFLPVLFSAFAAIFIAFLQKPILASLMILVIPTGLYLIAKQISSQKGIRVSLLRGKEKIDGKVVEMLGGIETIRVLNTNEHELKKVENIAEDLRKKEIKHHLAMALFDSVKYLNEGFFYILVIILAIFLSSKGIITKGDILVYSILFLSITGPLREIHRVLDEAHESSIKVNDLHNLLNQPLDISFKTTNKKESSIDKDLILNVKNLSFFYPEKKSEVLKNLNLKIHKGENIGIAGASGCGKTTFIHILLRLIHNYSGEVYLFNKSLLEIKREEIAQNFSYISQKTFIFEGSIKENIIYGQDGQVSEKDIIQAAKMANIYEEIVKDLGGFEGRVSENGNNLSGGQKQRLAIARVMLQKPELLIFDEATSALDNKNEATIQKNIEEVFKDKTIISIAHRLTTLKNCDRIIVFDKGKIVQEGIFGKLLKEDGLFKDFLRQKERKVL